MPRRSAGIALYRRGPSGLEVLLVHPGGPFWARRDEGAWSIPKGEYHDGEEEGRAAALREFAEETGARLKGRLEPLGSFRQPSGKIVSAWALEGQFDPARLRSNTFAMEWPPRSGVVRDFPEVDRAAWFPLAEARRRITKGQQPILDALARLAGPAGEAPPDGGGAAAPRQPSPARHRRPGR